MMTIKWMSSITGKLFSAVCEDLWPQKKSWHLELCLAGAKVPVKLVDPMFSPLLRWFLQRDLRLVTKPNCSGWICDASVGMGTPGQRLFQRFRWIHQSLRLRTAEDFMWYMYPQCCNRIVYATPCLVGANGSWGHDMTRLCRPHYRGDFDAGLCTFVYPECSRHGSGRSRNVRMHLQASVSPSARNWNSNFE